MGEEITDASPTGPLADWRIVYRFGGLWLTHECGDGIAEIEAGDTLDVLVRLALTHTC